MNLGIATAQFNLHGQGLPADALVTSYRSREVVSLPYEIDVSFCTGDFDFDVDECLRRRVALGVVNQRSSELSLTGGPVTLKGTRITIKAPLIKKTGGSLKVGG